MTITMARLKGIQLSIIFVVLSSTLLPEPAEAGIDRISGSRYRIRRQAYPGSLYEGSSSQYVAQQGLPSYYSPQPQTYQSQRSSSYLSPPSQQSFNQLFEPGPQPHYPPAPAPQSYSQPKTPPSYSSMPTLQSYNQQSSVSLYAPGTQAYNESEQSVSYPSAPQQVQIQVQSPTPTYVVPSPPQPQQPQVIQIQSQPQSQQVRYIPAPPVQPQHQVTYIHAPPPAAPAQPQHQVTYIHAPPPAAPAQPQHQVTYIHAPPPAAPAQPQQQVTYLSVSPPAAPAPPPPSYDPASAPMLIESLPPTTFPSAPPASQPVQNQPQPLNQPPTYYPQPASPAPEPKQIQSLPPTSFASAPLAPQPVQNQPQPLDQPPTYYPQSQSQPPQQPIADNAQLPNQNQYSYEQSPQPCNGHTYPQDSSPEYPYGFPKSPLAYIRENMPRQQRCHHGRRQSHRGTCPCSRRSISPQNADNRAVSDPIQEFGLVAENVEEVPSKYTRRSSDYYAPSYNSNYQDTEGLIDDEGLETAATMYGNYKPYTRHISDEEDLDQMEPKPERLYVVYRSDASRSDAVLPPRPSRNHQRLVHPNFESIQHRNSHPNNHHHYYYSRNVGKHMTPEEQQPEIKAIGEYKPEDHGYMISEELSNFEPAITKSVFNVNESNREENIAKVKTTEEAKDDGISDSAAEEQKPTQQHEEAVVDVEVNNKQEVFDLVENTEVPSVDIKEPLDIEKLVPVSPAAK